MSPETLFVIAAVALGVFLALFHFEPQIEARLRRPHERAPRPFCAACGAPLTPGHPTCDACGTPVTPPLDTRHPERSEGSPTIH